MGGLQWNSKIHMVAPLERFVREKSNFIEIHEIEKSEVRSLLKDPALFEMSEIVKRRWIIGGIDDISIFDNDASNLAMAMQGLGCYEFLVSPTDQILSKEPGLKAYIFPATQSGIELFQHPTWLELNVNDCLIFNLPMSFAVIRTGGVEYTLYGGQYDFVKTALGLSEG